MNATQIKKIASNQWGNYTVKGKSIKYNNLVQNGNFVDSSGWTKRTASDTFVVSNNEALITLSGQQTVTFGGITQGLNTYTGKKYLLRCQIKGNSEAVLNGIRTCIAINISGGEIIKTITQEYQTYEKIVTSNNNYASMYVGTYNSTNKTGNIYIKNVIVIDLTDLFGSGNEPATLEEFYATDLGKAIQSGFYPPYSATNVIYTATSPLTFKNNVDTQTVSILQNGQPLQLGGIGTARDYWLNRSGKVGRAIGSADLGTFYYISQNNSETARSYGIFQGRYLSPLAPNNITTPENAICNKYSIVTYNASGSDSNRYGIGVYNIYISIELEELANKTNAEVKEFMSGVYLHYEFAIPTNEQADSVMLRKGFTKCYDKNNLELDLDYE